MDEQISMFIETLAKGDEDCRELYYELLKLNTEIAARTFKYLSTTVLLKGEAGGRFWRACDKNPVMVIKLCVVILSKYLTWEDVWDFVKRESQI